MEKIPTLFKRGTSHRAIDQLSDHVIPPSVGWEAYEKLNGANVRVTVRNGKLVRLEARRNPSRQQKESGIVHPWYRDAEDEHARTPDVWLWRAARNVDYSDIPDGEWSGEAVGPKIQGNPYELEEPTIYFFSLIPWAQSLSSAINIPAVMDAPLGFHELKDWLPLQRSALNSNVPIEGVVWWYNDLPVAKIKVKDFRG